MERMRWMLGGALLVGLAAIAFGRCGDLRPDAQVPSVVERVRAIARLETLEVEVSKTVLFAPDPPPSSSFVGDVLTWASWELAPPEGRAIVSARARLGLDLSRLDEHSVHVRGDVLEILLPPLVTTVELEPERLEVIRSNLDSAQTAELLAKARRELEMDVSTDPALARKARESAANAIRRVLLLAGFREVRFVGEHHDAT